MVVSFALMDELVSFVLAPTLRALRAGSALISSRH
jgi:hypothetical protein